MAKLIKIKIPYYIENCGDGSAALRICSSLKEAKKLEQEEYEGWGESTVDTIEIEIDDKNVTADGVVISK